MSDSPTLTTLFTDPFRNCPDAVAALLYHMNKSTGGEQQQQLPNRELIVTTLTNVLDILQDLDEDL